MASAPSSLIAISCRRWFVIAFAILVTEPSGPTGWPDRARLRALFAVQVNMRSAVNAAVST